MTSGPYVRSALAQAVLGLAPPLIRKTLLQEKDFREEYSFEAEATISFGESGLSIQRSNLYDAVRKVLSGAVTKIVTEEVGRRWRLKDISKEGELPSLALSRGKQRLILHDFAALSPDRNVRLRSFDEDASDVNLPKSTRDRWRIILAERALADDEVDPFHKEFVDTPIHIARSIRKGIADGTSSVSTLVPPSRRYFERLVGEYDGSVSIGDYAAGSGRALLHELVAWRPYDGFLLGLLLGSHSALTAEMVVDQLSCEDLARAFNFLIQNGDRTSQLGAIEIGLRVLASRPEIEPVLVRLIQKIRDDDVNGKRSGFRLLSSLFVLVDGELSRTRLLSADPPFYRRLVALSQAALIHRLCMSSAVDIDRFCDWAFNFRGEQYYLQSLADMRLEPRWNPDLATASQIKADFFGRIMIAARNYKQNIKGGDLVDLVFGEKAGSLRSLSDFFHPYLPGPLEGGEDTINILPAEFAEAIAAQLGAEEIGASSFFALVNSALIFRVGVDQAELAAQALKLGSYRLANVQDRAQLLAILTGLATAAASSRSWLLADELRILVRRYMRDPEYAVSINEAMNICLVSAASRADLIEWTGFIGDWLIELAFSDLKGDDGEVLLSHLQCLFHAVPELWVSCGRADAALRAYIGR